MHRGFAVTALPDSWARHNGEESPDQVARQIVVDDALDQFVSPNGSIDAKALSQNWFPVIRADIFISHSHNDRRMALALSDYLESNLGLSCFVDSTIWKSADRLLKQIDDEHCLGKAPNTYSYERRNLSTSHVHMMLVMAIAKMIDEAEAVFFLPTPKAMSPRGTTRKGETASPWIFAEIALSHLVRKTLPTRQHTTTFESRAAVAKDRVPVKHPVDLTHLTELSPAVLERWEQVFRGRRHQHALDSLYAVVPDNGK